MTIPATFIDSTSFVVANDQTSDFMQGRRVKANCEADGYKYGTIESSLFDTTSTTVVLTSASDDLTSNLTEVQYGIIGKGTNQSMPVHSHLGNEGDGDKLTEASISNLDKYTQTEVDGFVNGLQSDIDTHVNDSDIHFTEDSIDHNNIQNIGIRSHDDLDNIFDDRSEPTGFVTTDDSTLSFDGTSLTITSLTETFYYISGLRYSFTDAKTAGIIGEGPNFFYLNSAGELLVSQSFSITTLLEQNAYVAVVYWNSTQNKAIYIGDERHGVVWDWNLHAYHHLTEGTKFQSGLGLIDVEAFSSDSTSFIDTTSAALTFGIGSGVIRDEDLVHTISQINKGSSSFIVLYREGDGVWYHDGPTEILFKNFSGGSNRVAWNEYTGGIWQQTEVVDSAYTLVHVFATNDINYPIVGVQSQTTFSSIDSARDQIADDINGIITGDMPFQEFIDVASLVIYTENNIVNDYKAAFIYVDSANSQSYEDFRGFKGVSTGNVSITDHGNLSGLGDDDHLLYSRIDGSRDFTGPVGGIDPVSSNDLTTKSYVDQKINTDVPHNSTTGLQGGDQTSSNYYHLSLNEYDELTGGLETTLHYHNHLADDGELGVVYTNGGSVDLYYNAIKILSTNKDGIDITDSDGPSPAVRLYGNTGTITGIIQCSSDVLYFFAGPSATQVAHGDPAGEFSLYYQGSDILSTAAQGILIKNDDGNIVGYHTENGVYAQETGNGYQIRMYVDGAGQGLIQNQVSTGQGMYIRARNGANDGYNTILYGHPDAGAQLYYAGNSRLTTHAFGAQVGDGVDHSISSGQYQLSVAGAGYAGYVALDAVSMQIGHLSNSRDLRLVIGSSAKIALNCNPNAGIELYYDGTKRLSTVNTVSGGIYVHGDSNAEGRIYWNSSTLSIHAQYPASASGIYLYNNNASGTVRVALRMDGAAYLYTIDGSGNAQLSYLGSQGGTSYVCSNGNYVARTIPTGWAAYSDGVQDLGSGSVKWHTVYATTASINTSDERLKEDIEDSPLGLDFINKLRPVKYKWKDREIENARASEKEDFIITKKMEINVRPHYGLISQEVKTVLDDYEIDFAGYIHDEESDSYGLRYSEFIAPMIKAIQELTDRIKTLEKEKGI